MPGKISDSNKKLLVTVGLSVAAYFIVLKPILEKLGLKKSAEEKKKEQEETTNLSDAQKKIQAQGIVLSKSKAEWDQIANVIYNDLRFSALDDNKRDAAYQLARVKNDADILYLIQTFGKRQEYFFGLPTGDPQSLPEFIRSNLSDSVLSQVNVNYQRKGIKYQF